MAQITFELESVSIMDASAIIDVPASVEITVDLELPEIWGFSGQTIGYGRPYVLGVEFSASLGIGSQEANRAFEKHLAVLYESDEGFQKRVYELALEAYYSAKSEAEIDAYEAERSLEVSHG